MTRPDFYGKKLRPATPTFLLIASTPDLEKPHCMKIFLPAFAALALMAPSKEMPAEATKATDFIRVERGGENVLLQPAAATYEKEGVKVTLLGAVHIADKAYFDDLNKRFKTYDRVLFEMIGGENLGAAAKSDEPKADAEKPGLSALGDVYKMVSSFLKLADQKTEIDYTAKNFVHADLTMAEFQKLQEDRGESLLGFAMNAAKNADPKDQPSTMALMTALMSGKTNQAKLLLMDALAGGDEAMAGIVQQSVIITDRNNKAIKVLDNQIAKGHKNLAIFYGAAHFPDMEKNLLGKGYKKSRLEWLTAWKVAK